MKNSILTALIFLLLLSSCGQNKAKQQQQAVHDMMEKYDGDEPKSEQTSQEAKTPSTTYTGSSLMGEWKCSLLTSDSNSNGMLDNEEKASGSNTYNDYLKLNPDGTCEYTVAQLNGTYEIVEKEGHKSIEVIAKDGSRIKYGRIISLKPHELQLMKFSGGRDIIVYNRP